VKSPVEVEIKLSLPSLAKGRALLRQHDFKVIKPRVFEENLVLDNPAKSLYDLGVLLRVRRAGKTITCTAKGPEGAPGRHKKRVENEFKADDFDAVLAFFATIGYKESFRYEKYRTEFRRAGEPGHVTLDETPIGAFMELEGPARWIDQTAKLLRFDRNAFITASYGRLYAAWRVEMPDAPADMRFK
jgi:adenylate cyclase class 2